MVFEPMPREGSGKAAHTPALVSPVQGGRAALHHQEGGGSIPPTNPPPKPAAPLTLKQTSVLPLFMDIPSLQPARIKKLHLSQGRNEKPGTGHFLCFTC